MLPHNGLTRNHGDWLECEDDSGGLPGGMQWSPSDFRGLWIVHSISCRHSDFQDDEGVAGGRAFMVFDVRWFYDLRCCVHV